MSRADDVTAVTDFVRVQARERPDAAAFWFEGRETSFADLDARSSRCAQALLAAGVPPGGRVATLCKNTDAFPVLWFGAMKARACAVPVNTRLAPPEIAAIVEYIKSLSSAAVRTGPSEGPAYESIPRK